MQHEIREDITWLDILAAPGEGVEIQAAAVTETMTVVAIGVADGPLKVPGKFQKSNSL